MPRIPKKERSGISQRVAAANLNSSGAGAVGEALSRVGGTIADVGFQYAERAVKQEAREYVAKADREMQFEIEEFKAQQQQKLNSGEIDVTGYQASIRAFSGGVSTDLQRKAPNRLAEREFSLRGQALSETAVFESDLFANKYRRQTAGIDSDQAFLKIGQNAKNYNVTIDTLKKHEESIINSIHFDEKEKEARLIKGRKGVGDSYVYNQIQTGSQLFMEDARQRILKDDEIFNQHTEAQKQALLNSLNVKLKQEKNKTVLGLAERTKDIVARLQTNPTDQEALLAAEKTVSQVSALEPEDDSGRLVRYRVDIQNAMKLNEIAPNLRTVEDYRNFNPSFVVGDVPLEEASEQGKFKELLSEYRQKKLRQTVEDPGQFVLEAEPSLKFDDPGLPQVYKSLGIKDVRLPKQEEKRMEYLLQNSPNRLEALNTFQSQYGVNSGRFLSQMARKNKALMDYYFANKFRATDNNLSQIMLNPNLKDAPKDYENKFGKGTFREVKRKVSEELKEVMVAYGNFPGASNFLVERSAAFAALERGRTVGLDETDAIDAAVNKVKSGIGVVKVSNGRDSYIPLEGSLNQPEILDGTKATMEILTDERFKEQAKPYLNLHPGQAKNFKGVDDFYDNTIDTWEFERSPDDDGIYVTYLDRTGSRFRVKTSDEDGNPTDLKISFNDMFGQGADPTLTALIRNYVELGRFGRFKQDLTKSISASQSEFGRSISKKVSEKRSSIAELKARFRQSEGIENSEPPSNIAGGR